VRIEQVEEILDTMVSAGWVSRTMQGGWVLQRDPATITVEDIYRLFVFRADTRRPAKGADPELDQRVHELGARMSENLQVTLDKFFAEGEDEATLHAEAAVAAAKPGLQSVVSR
jgi:membrane protein